MIIIGVLLNVIGLGAFCWALFALAIHALPFFVGMTVGIYSYQAGAGPSGAIVVGFVAGEPSRQLGRRPRAGDSTGLSSSKEVGLDRSVEARIVQLDRDIALRSHTPIEPGDPVSSLRSGGSERFRWSDRRGDTWPPFCTPGFVFLRPECGASCVGRSLAGTSPKCCSAHASTWPLIGLIWPKAGYASIA